jgi:hypothetical protein
MVDLYSKRHHAGDHITLNMRGLQMSFASITIAVPLAIWSRLLIRDGHAD